MSEKILFCNFPENTWRKLAKLPFQMWGIWIEFKQQLVWNVIPPILSHWDGGADVVERMALDTKHRERKAKICDVSQPAAKLPGWLERKFRKYLLSIQCDREMNETITYTVPLNNTTNTSCTVLKYPVSQIRFWVQITWEVSPFPTSFWMCFVLGASGR